MSINTNRSSVSSRFFFFRVGQLRISIFNFSLKADVCSVNKFSLVMQLLSFVYRVLASHEVVCSETSFVSGSFWKTLVLWCRFLLLLVPAYLWSLVLASVFCPSVLFYLILNVQWRIRCTDVLVWEFHIAEESKYNFRCFSFHLQLNTSTSILTAFLIVDVT